MNYNQTNGQIDQHMLRFGVSKSWGGADLGFGGLGVCVLELWRVSNREQQVGVVGGWKSKF